MKSETVVLLINPWIYDFSAYDLWSKPLGLLYLGSLFKNAGYKVKLIDCLDHFHPELPEEPEKKLYGCGHYYWEDVEKPPVYKHIPRKYKRYGYPLALFKKELKNLKSPPQAILITSIMTYWYPGVFKAIEIIRDYFKDVPIILGGIYATLCYEHALKYSEADYVIRYGQGREILRLVDEIVGNKRSDYRQFPQTFLEYPYPAYELLRERRYICLLTSYGCPFRCSYCASWLLESKFLQRQPQGVVEEINYWHKKFGVKNFAFYDNALLVDAENHLCLILEEIIRREIKCFFHTPNGLHIRFISWEVADLLFKANFKTIRLSLETTNSRRQQISGGKVSNLEFKQAITNLLNAGYNKKDIGVYIMCGLPGQDEDEVEAGIIFLRNLGVKIKLVEYSPIPGTKEWEKGVREFGFDPIADPLLHNNSALPFLSRERYNRLKNLCVGE
ncbi:MAG: radical SAM protein [bacterium]